jgi:hypothetical protein
MNYTKVQDLMRKLAHARSDCVVDVAISKGLGELCSNCERFNENHLSCICYFWSIRCVGPELCDI